MSITAGRCNAVRQVAKDLIDDLEANHPGDDVTALHAALAAADDLAGVVMQRLFGTGPQPLDGEPKPPPKGGG